MSPICKRRLPANFVADYAAGRLPAAPLPALGADQLDQPAAELLACSLLPAREELFGPPDFFSPGHDFRTGCWLLEYAGTPVLMVSAAGRGTSYLVLTPELPPPDFWPRFAARLAAQLARTATGTAFRAKRQRFLARS